MTNTKKELAVAALENGTVIDRIPSEQLFKVVSMLKLDTIANSITIGNNLGSKKIGKKGIIKVADYFFKDEEINKIALIAPDATINVIRDYKVVEKYSITLHETLRGIVRCNNPKCISNNEPMETVFHVTRREPLEVTCRYCNRSMNAQEIEIL
ncbi:MAG: aspartate carbamoyltransferase regulatory subunit [Bacteroidaceae bacterium]|nr:aspartate carbamoyltransferase regulatory subunit [Bacteroidaceae bacterium]